MGEFNANPGPLAAATKRIARRLLIVAENRLELLTLEAQEERERLLQAFLLALGAAVFGLLAGLAFTAAVVVLLWTYSPVAILFSLAAVYGAAAVALGWRLTRRNGDEPAFGATLDQLRKDRVCLEKILE